MHRICIVSQINFRVKEDEKQIIQALAAQRGLSVPELAKQVLMKEISPLRVELAFQLLQEGKIGKKRAFTMSGLSYHEFLDEWVKRGAEEHISDESYKRGLQTAYSIDLTALRRKSPPSPDAQ